MNGERIGFGVETELFLFQQVVGEFFYFFNSVDKVISVLGGFCRFVVDGLRRGNGFYSTVEK